MFERFTKQPEKLDARDYPIGGRLLVIANHRPEVTVGDVDWLGISFDELIPGGLMCFDVAALKWLWDRDWYRRMDERQYASRPLTLREIMEFYDVIRERGWENTVMVDEILRDAWEGKGIV